VTCSPHGRCVWLTRRGRLGTRVADATPTAAQVMTAGIFIPLLTLFYAVATAIIINVGSYSSDIPLEVLRVVCGCSPFSPDRAGAHHRSHRCVLPPSCCGTLSRTCSVREAVSMRSLAVCRATRPFASPRRASKSSFRSVRCCGTCALASPISATVCIRSERTCARSSTNRLVSRCCVARKVGWLTLFLPRTGGEVRSASVRRGGAVQQEAVGQGR
jgi:hypothetical protein